MGYYYSRQQTEKVLWSMANLTMSENLERILLGWVRLFSEAESYVFSLTHFSQCSICIRHARRYKNGTLV